MAEEYLARELGRQTTAGAGGIREVLRLDELQFRAPWIHGFPPERLRDCWIAYVDRRVRGLSSSEVILVDVATGEVQYAGSAHDEG